jgi:hypothetical protein
VRSCCVGGAHVGIFEYVCYTINMKKCALGRRGGDDRKEKQAESEGGLKEEKPGWG